MKINYPPTCDTKTKKLNFLAELDEKLRLWHNSQTVGMTRTQASSFFKNQFYPRSKTVHDAINGLTTYSIDINSQRVKTKGVKGNTWNPDLGSIEV